MPLKSMILKSYSFADLAWNDPTWESLKMGYSQALIIQLILHYYHKNHNKLTANWGILKQRNQFNHKSSILPYGVSLLI